MTTDPARIAAFRAELEKDGLTGFVVPLTDRHMSEYVGEGARRLAWLTGFESSAGTAVILRDKAAIFVDGRYAEQVRRQTSAAIFTYEEVPATSVAGWIAAHAKAGDAIGYDPWLHRRGFVVELEGLLQPVGAELRAVAENPIDRLWRDRPAPSAAPAVPYPLARAGEESASKRARLMAAAREKGADVVLVAALDALSWLFNMRGQDVRYTPVVEGFALVEDGGARLFLRPEKVTDALRAHLGADVAIADEAAFGPALAALDGRRVLVDPQFVAAAICATLTKGGARIVEAPNPIQRMKAEKNATELAGMRAAHVRDGVAMVRFLAGVAADPPVDEQAGEARIDALRAEVPLFQDLSFVTISAFGANAALPHYQATPETNVPITAPGIYLVDSGGQYLDGTTDITRTMAIGTPTDAMRRHFTLVLKGHVALAMARFPAGTSGGQLDALARQFLWADGLDYKHGTGHGVGHYLSVHEGPQRIATRNSAEPLRAGMVVSNEPGYYPVGTYGIRIESLVAVVADPHPGDEQPMLAFETLTLVPIDRNLIDVKLLTARERDWIDRYHARVRAAHRDAIAGAAREWLIAATEPLPRP